MPLTFDKYLELIDETGELKKTFRQVPRVAVVGAFQSGKSTFVNCYLDGLWAKPGNGGLRTTALSTRFSYGDSQRVRYR